VMLLDFVAWAGGTPGIGRGRIGRGRNNTTRRFLARVKKHGTPLGWRVTDEGWVAFVEAPVDRVERKRREESCADVHGRNRWGDSESGAGPGSNRARAAAFSAELPALLDAFGVRTLLDAPCGDFNWMREVPWSLDRYVGVDIVPEIVEKNQRVYGSETRSFLHRDL